MRFLSIGAVAVISLVSTLGSEAFAQRPVKLGSHETALISKLNEGTIGLAAGLPEGAPLRFATELARVVDDGIRLRVLPIVTRGPSENVQDLLYLRGVDAAIVYGDILDQLKKDPKVAAIEKRMNYITHLFPSEVHVFVRPEIKSLEDLVGQAGKLQYAGDSSRIFRPYRFRPARHQGDAAIRAPSCRHGRDGE